MEDQKSGEKYLRISNGKSKKGKSTYDYMRKDIGIFDRG